ncbi:MAG: alpha/beta hydrolase [Lachnospiraceae bacterium]|nr:alpha/beta hydrolase [Lachnospiraceae bacterium]
MLKNIIIVALLIIGAYLIIQAVRCKKAIQAGFHRLANYQAENIELSYGNMSYVDQGEGDVILSVHGIFGGYDQAFDTCADFVSNYRILAPSRFGYLGSSVYGDGTPEKQAEAYVELLDRLGIEQVYVLSTSAGGSVAIRFALDYPERTKGLIFS